MSGMKFLDEKIIALRNEMRDQERHELAQQQAALQVEQEPEQDEQDNLQEVDIYQNIITIDDEEVQVIEQPLLDGKMIIRMPKLFSIMSAELASLKYPSERRPNLIYTDTSSSINLAFNLTPHRLNEDGVAAFQENMMDILEQAQPSADWLDTDVQKIDGKTVGFLEVITPAIDGEIFNLMFFASVEGRALIGTFNCMEDDLDTWRPIARAMMESLQFTSSEGKGGTVL
ncbi:hypothetical protein J2D69_15115 [Lysinibacillus sphaericus]|uniref:Uncharacterized protein n=3 Tax=Lysinibacillus TaxID=400634 RepID=B1HSM2_LYSSC|nr:conserved hypothetical protein [Lysinibacillus sphaericus C3-41]AMO32986.1 hypothetical protein AR327_11335 [Lysinibacillus sphaericus]EWH33006.1 hypothetical protein P799_13220 [Lysinibacillus sphaericus CBAM5]MBE5083127.1 hypothetical protein [Bacillus thuringiensis]MBG9724105.1 hypothetical protein [Lysinibacillus fusiformis]